MKTSKSKSSSNYDWFGAWFVIFVIVIDCGIVLSSWYLQNNVSPVGVVLVVVSSINLMAWLLALSASDQ